MNYKIHNNQFHRNNYLAGKIFDQFEMTLEGE